MVVWQDKVDLLWCIRGEDEEKDENEAMLSLLVPPQRSTWNGTCLWGAESSRPLDRGALKVEGGQKANDVLSNRFALFVFERLSCNTRSCWDELDYGRVTLKLDKETRMCGRDKRSSAQPQLAMQRHWRQAQVGPVLEA